MKTKALILLFLASSAFADAYYYDCNTFSTKISSAMELSMFNLKFYAGSGCIKKLDAIQKQSELVDLVTSYSNTACPFQDRSLLQSVTEVFKSMQETGPKELAKKFDKKTLELSDAIKKFNTLIKGEVCEDEAAFKASSEEIVKIIDEAIPLAKELDGLDCPDFKMQSRIDDFTARRERIIKKTQAQLSDCDE